jgi:hypothetical protein
MGEGGLEGVFGRGRRGVLGGICIILWTGG